MNAPPAVRIYITGFMGSGKSTVGPLLAARLGYEFVDLDARIEEVEGKAVPEIFSERGEAVFRQRDCCCDRRRGAHRSRIMGNHPGIGSARVSRSAG